MDELDVQVQSILATYSNDLWIERRLRLKEVMARLEGHGSGSSQSWYRFIEFLEEHCSGLGVELHDKQWGELLNLMMISKKLNHKSVKFKHIMANKQQIESNAKQIRDFSAVALVGKAIESGLGELERLLRSCSMIWPTGSQSDLVQLAEARGYLAHKCQPLAYSLRLSLSDERITKDLRLECWRRREMELGSLAGKLSDFIAAMISLQTKLIKLRQLDQAKEASSRGLATSKVRQSIESCRKEMREIQRFHQEKVDLLYQLAKRICSAKMIKSSDPLVLPLVKVFEPKAYISIADIQRAVDRLDRCGRRLEEIMHNLKREFGRFFFLNDMELLTVVMVDSRLIIESGQEAGYKRIVCKLYNNSISSFVLDESQEHLTGVQSPSSEVINFAVDDFIALRKAMQVYSLDIIRILNEMERKLRKTLKTMLMKSIEQQSDEWAIDWCLPVQLIELAESVKFCSRVEKTLQSCSSTKSSLAKLAEHYEQLSVCSSHQPRGELATSGKISAALSICVHFLSVLMTMKEASQLQVGDWLWQKQLRYYVLSEEDKLEVRIADAKFRYKFDYLHNDQLQEPNERSAGSLKRLIGTKVTERCFLMASQAVCHLRLGANPFGPAGGGKTETIKALGRLLGQQVIVHNCDETNDLESLDQLIWGLAHTGLWGCFDEFNRLSSCTMSVISATLELVQSSIRENRLTVSREDGDERMMCIDQDSAFFITLNPVSVSPEGVSPNKGRYQGRRQLPANLRGLFLPISMVQVQIDAIVSENFLVLHIGEQAGLFKDNGGSSLLQLGAKMEEFISQMRRLEFGGARCEWDLRLVMAILQRLRLMLEPSSGVKLSGDLMIQALCCEVEPRLSHEECAHFHLSLQKVFGSSFRPLEGKFEDNEQDKVAHLRRLLQTRTGVLLLGPTKTGKSTTWRSLLDQDPSLRWMAINPKSCSQLELLGGFFEDEQAANRKKWRDGHLTSKVREAEALLQSNESIRQICILLDGPIDPDWIESLNSVLDDNRMLTLGSGERLNFYLPSGQSVKLIFETASIEFASPATISRLGLIYFESQPEAETGQVRCEDLEMLDNHLKQPNWSLAIVYGENLDCQAIGSHLKPTSASLSYSCSPNTNSHHLIDLLSWSPTKQLYLMHNVHLIEANDQWKAKNFMELLRFMVEYRGYYGEQSEFMPINEVKFLLTCQQLDQIDQRLVSKADLVLQLKSSRNHNIISPERLMPDKIGETVKQSPLLIIRNKVHTSIRQMNQMMASADRVDVCTFENSSEAQKSLDLLRKQVMNGARDNLFILHDLELNLMDTGMRSELLHQLNRLHETRMKFVYVSGADQVDSYLSSLAGFCILDIAEVDFAQIIRDLLLKTFEFGDSKISVWLEGKILAAASGDQERIELLVGAFLRLFHRSFSDLLLQKNALKNGLDHLDKFDEQVERMRLECEQQKASIRDKNAQIGRTSELIDAGLLDSEQQSQQIGELHRQLEVKKSAMLKKSEQLTGALAQVDPMLEASRAEVSQHLKPEALSEIKTLRSPSGTIKDILDALFTLLGARDLSWSAMKSYLASKSLKDELTNYKFEARLDEDILKRVQSIISRREDSFSADQAGRASKAVVPLLSWIKSALAYGEVLIKSGPLREELEELEEQLTKTNGSIREARDNLATIKANIRSQEDLLSRLRGESEELELESAMVGQQLQKSQELRSNLENQTARWLKDLHRINYLLVDDRMSANEQLIKMCLMVSSLALDWAAVSSRADKLTVWLDEFDLAKEVRESNWMDSFTCEQSPLGLLLSSSNLHLSGFKPSQADESRVVELVALKQLTELLEAPWLPAILVDGRQSAIFDEDQIVASLSYGNILRSSRQDICYVRFQSDLADLHHVVGANVVGRNKLICLDVRMIQEETSLDLAHFLFNRTKTDAYKFVLLGTRQGKLEQSLSRYLIGFSSHLIDLDGRHDAEQIQEGILVSILEMREPDLMDDLARRQRELQQKMENMKMHEINLLNQLVSASLAGGTKVSGTFGAIVGVLSELQQLNLHLANDREALEKLRESLNSKRLKYLATSQESARFYMATLAPLRGFSRFSVRKFTKLLFESLDLDAEQVEVKSKMQLIIRQASNSMEPEQRSAFVAKVRGANLVDGREEAGTSSHTCTGAGAGAGAGAGVAAKLAHRAKTQLGKTILRDVLADSGGITRRNRYQLVVVLHDPIKSSSPQQELDYLFAAGGRLEACTALVTYDKVYATGSRFGQAQLEAALRRFLASKGNNNNNTSTSSNNNNNNNNRGFVTEKLPEQRLRCLCVVNAHLSTTWLNANLLRCLEEAPQLDNEPRGLSLANHQDELRLLILIGETGSAKWGSLFDERLLDHAQLRYWHDELALSLVDRYTVYLSSGTASNHEDKHGRLRAQLILFHVVCQERTKMRPGTGTQTVTWLRAYNFDRSQLDLALKTLDRLANTMQADDLRARLSDYLADVVYGSRMETREDEQELDKLIARYVRSSESAGEQLDRLESLIGQEQR